MLVLGGCEAGALAGRTEATAPTTVYVGLSGRTLVLDGFAGEVTVRGVPDADSAIVRLTRRARGTTADAARQRLGRVAVETASDSALVQVVWRTSLDDGASVDADVLVPEGAHVVVRLGSGRAQVLGVPNADVEVGTPHRAVPASPAGGTLPPADR